MKKRLWVIPIMLLVICLVGCNNTPSPTVPDEPNVEVTTPDDATNPSNGDVMTPVEDIKHQVVMDGKFVWDKDYKKLSPTDIKFDKNWDSYITVGNTKIVTDALTDMSVLDNYFYDGVLTNADNMQMAYELNWRDFYAKAETVAENPLANGEVMINASTYPSDTIVLDKYNRNLIITSVRYNSYAAEFEEILNALKAVKVSDNNAWGVGSTYEDVVALIGQPSVEYSEDVFEHSIITTATYETDKCNLSITYFTETPDNKGFVIGFVWTPIQLNNYIVQQDGYADFYSGLYSDLQFDTSNNNESELNEDINDASDNNNAA